MSTFIKSHITHRAPPYIAGRFSDSILAIIRRVKRAFPLRGKRMPNAIRRTQRQNGDFDAILELGIEICATIEPGQYIHHGRVPTGNHQNVSVSIELLVSEIALVFDVLGF